MRMNYGSVNIKNVLPTFQNQQTKCLISPLVVCILFRIRFRHLPSRVEAYVSIWLDTKSLCSSKAVGIKISHVVGHSPACKDKRQSAVNAAAGHRGSRALISCLSPKAWNWRGHKDSHLSFREPRLLPKSVNSCLNCSACCSYDVFLSFNPIFSSCNLVFIYYSDLMGFSCLE